TLLALGPLSPGELVAVWVPAEPVRGKREGKRPRLLVSVPLSPPLPSLGVTGTHSFLHPSHHSSPKFSASQVMAETPNPHPWGLCRVSATPNSHSVPPGRV
uniref:Uncharacterized protein n=1 Tax=Zosterops lateralis melanops TaxID=1220523 RepID=A0A8D2PQN6_ZOSLA